MYFLWNKRLSAIVSSTVITSMLGLNFMTIAHAADMASAMEKAKNGDFSELKAATQSDVSTIKAGRSSYTMPEGFGGTHGGEDDRNFNDAHTNGDGSDNGIKSSGIYFKIQMENNPDTSEAKAFNALKGVYESEEYHTRDRDYKDFGDKVTLQSDETSALLTEYERLAQDAENGTSCQIEIVTPAVIENRTTSTDESCIFSDAPVYWPSSCQVTRRLTLPRVLPENNLALTDNNNGVNTQHNGTIVYPRDFALDKEVKFKLESPTNIGATLTLPSILPNNHYIFVNGNRISNSGAISLGEYLQDGENTIRASCSYGPLLNTSQELAPVGGQSTGPKAQFCRTPGSSVYDGFVSRGDIAWGANGFAKKAYRGSKAREAAGACPNGYFHVGWDDNYDRGWQDASEAARRCFKPHEAPVCEKLSNDILSVIGGSRSNINAEKAEFLHWYSKLRSRVFNPSPGHGHNPQYYWPNKTQAKPDGKPVPLFPDYREVPNYGGRSYPRDNGSAGAQTYSKYRIYGDGSAGLYGWTRSNSKGAKYFWADVSDEIACIKQSGKWVTAGPCRVPSLAGVYDAYSLWDGMGLTPQYSGHAFLTTTYRLGCGNPPLNLSIQFNHVNAIQSVTEQPANCVSGNNQFVRALDGSLHYNLQGNAFPYTGSATLPSTNIWECTDFDSSRNHGSHINTQATLNYVKGSIVEMYPGGDLVSPNICYTARAPRYGVDISGAGKCADGTFSCWDPSAVTSHLPDYLKGRELFASSSSTPITDSLLGSIPGVKTAEASMNGANTVGEAADVNLCTDLEAADNCTFKTQTCDITDALSGDCRLWEKIYTCTTEEEVVVSPPVTRKTCTSLIPCSEGGDEYCEYTDEVNDDFQKAAVSLSVASLAKDDSNCLSNDLSSCVMFEGEAKECRSYVSAGLGEALPTGNCCKRPDGSPGPIAYVQTLYAISQTEYVQTLAADIGTAVVNSGVWQDYVVAPAEYVADLAVQGYDAAADWFANQAASLGYQAGTDVAATAGTEAAQQSLGASISSGMNFLAADISSVMGDILGDWIVEDVVRDEITGEVLARSGDYATQAAYQEAANQAAQEAGTTAVQSTAIDSGVAQAVGTAFSVVMAIYAAYKITMLVNQILIACGDKEFESAYKIGTGSCSQIANNCTSSNLFGCKEKTSYYCCYNSPLARIIHEQAHLSGQSANALGWETSQAWATFNNDCPGFTYTDFASLDFDRIDLQEWIDLLVDAGKLPDGSAESIAEYTDVDLVTRSVARNQEGFDPDTTDVQNAVERAEGLMGTAGDNMEEYRHAEREMMIMEDQYETQYEDCFYAHEDGTSYDGTKGFVIYADGSKNYTTGCLKKEGGAAYPHVFENCPDVTQPDGTIVTPVTRYFIGRFDERVDLAICQIPSS
jgi:hypothetical protein